RAKMFEVYPDLAEIYRTRPQTSNVNDSGSAGANFKAVDSNADGRISIEEVFNAIDKFFEGELDVSSSYISDLIDYFFDQ
ncbi:MAG: hypothetical protein KDB98_14485, partial [Flavobacteriales bacterium]|nr:hypothetical protein [Flavobacteriales bacterium]